MALATASGSLHRVLRQENKSIRLLLESFKRVEQEYQKQNTSAVQVAAVHFLIYRKPQQRSGLSPII